MRVPLSWLREFVDVDVQPEKLKDMLDLSGTKVEALHRPGRSVKGVIVGEVLAVEEHPNADNLVLVEVRAGDDEVERVVCGARNFAPGDHVPFAQVGAQVGDLSIGERKIRGQVSRGMLCSAQELGVARDHSGILILPPDTSPGTDVVDILGLDDVIFELELTPNRPDCMSIRGVAREVAAMLGLELKDPDRLGEPPVTVAGNGGVEVTIDEPEGCPRYLARYIEGVTVGASPAWLVRRLLATGVRPISNVVDVTNYVLMELGHPMHAFDAALVHKRRIVVRRARSGERLTTLDGTERALSTDDLLIADPKRPLALAGVMGGGDSEVSDTTTDVILEAAQFDHRWIAYTSRRHQVRTEASARFERGADPEIIPFAAERAASLIAQLAGGRAAQDPVDAYPRPAPVVRVTLRPSRTDAVLGVSIAAESQIRHLRALGLAVEPTSDALQVTIPSFRSDLTREEDLIEEVARLAGFDKLPATVPPGRAGGLEPGQAAERFVRATLTGLGLHEAQTTSFMAPGDLDRLALDAEHPARAAVELANPTSDEEPALRTTLLPGLLRSLALNTAHRARGVALFELARIYEPSGVTLPHEPSILAGVVWGERIEPGWTGAGLDWDFFGAKGTLDALFDSLRLTAIYAPASGMPFHPTRAATVAVGGTSIGVLGEIHPDVCEAFDAPEGAIVFELTAAPLLKQVERAASMEELARFPGVYIDMAVVVDEAVPAGSVGEVVLRAGAPELTSARLFDLYRGPQIPEGSKSLAYALEIRAPDRTLTEEEALAVRDRIVTELAEAFGAELRA